MMKRAALLTAFAFFSAIAAAAAQDRPIPMNQGQMDRLDTNRDGAVSEAEYQAYTTRAFANLDKNKDGNLSRDEAAQLLNAQQFAATDANGDGQISRDEFMNKVMADFRAADRDGDGKLQ